MSKEYVFEYRGTKEDLLKFLDSRTDKISCDGCDSYYINDYIVEVKEDSVRFGIERGDHSCGYWFVPSVTEKDGKIEFRGSVKYTGRGYSAFTEVLLYVAAFPFILIFWIYALTEELVRKIFKKSKPKSKTTKEKLFDLMENCLDCTGK